MVVASGISTDCYFSIYVIGTSSESHTLAGEVSLPSKGEVSKLGTIKRGTGCATQFSYEDFATCALSFVMIC